MGNDGKTGWKRRRWRRKAKKAATVFKRFSLETEIWLGCVVAPAREQTLVVANKHAEGLPIRPRKGIRKCAVTLARPSAFEL